VFADGVAAFGGGEQESVHADEFVAAVTEKVAEPLVAVDDDAVFVNHDAAERGVIKGFEALLALAQGRFALPERLQHAVETPDQLADFVVLGQRQWAPRQGIVRKCGEQAGGVVERCELAPQNPANQAEGHQAEEE